jgi:caffeoyl-CoA O-methyltransferase
MKAITIPGIEEYAERHSVADPVALAELAEDTRRRFEMPQMMVGPVEGRFLQVLFHGLRPHRVLEIGTFTGYSALSMAAALPPGGRIVTCEVDPRHAEAARRNIAASEHAHLIDIEVGPALETLARLPGQFDFVFIDADKRSYGDYLEAVLPKLSDHGLIAADNTLWNGEVCSPGTDDPDAQALRRFNAAVVADPRLICVLLTVRDGVTLIRRA